MMNSSFDGILQFLVVGFSHVYIWPLRIISLHKHLILKKKPQTPQKQKNLILMEVFKKF